MPTSLLGLLLGFGVIIYMLLCIKRGYLLASDWRRTVYHLSRQQEPLAFWPLVIVCLLIGSVVVAACLTAILSQWTVKPW
jgi:hypothetical protein